MTQRILFLAFLGFSFSLPAQAADEIYNRVMESGKLRCGYGAEEPYLYKDPNSGEIRGIFHDYVEQMAENLSLDVVWAEEMGWGEFPAALANNRVDAFCSVAWKTAGRAREVDYVTPVTYQPVLVAVRADDTRFDGNPAALNKPDVTFSSVDGNAEIEVIKKEFPEAKLHTVPQIGAFSSALMDVANGKADAIVVAGSIYAQFEEKNPGRLKVLDMPPIQLKSEAMTVKAGEHTLRRMLDAATIQLLEGGAIEEIVNSYGLPPETFYIAEPSYKKR